MFEVRNICFYSDLIEEKVGGIECTNIYFFRCHDVHVPGTWSNDILGLRPQATSQRKCGCHVEILPCSSQGLKAFVLSSLWNNLCKPYIPYRFYVRDMTTSCGIPSGSDTCLRIMGLFG